MLKRHFHRRNLPHLYYNEGIYFVTSRLYGSIHPAELEKLNLQMKTNPQKKLFKKYDSLLDKLYNNINYLSRIDIAQICKSSIHHCDGKEFRLICYCIMPNHVHLVFELLNKEKSVGDIMGSIKKFTGRRSNVILNKEGTFWQAENFDRMIRDEIELYFVIKYVLLNPVDAGFASCWKDYEHTYCHPDFQVLP